MLHSSLRATALAASAIAFAVGCSEAPPPAAKTPLKAPVVAATAAAPPPVVPAGHLARLDVDLVLTRLGPPWLLRRVLREEVYDKAGKFAGWRLTGLPEEWSAVDLHPGDIVMRVNGMSVETPDDAWEAWKSMAKAKELKLTLARDGASRELVVPIDGAPTPEVIQALDRDAPPPRPEDGRPQRSVVRIGGEDEGEGDSY